MHLTVRQNICDYIIQNRARFKDFMEDDVDVTEYTAKMLLDGEWGGHVELVAFSELYSVQIQIFDSIGCELPITTVTTPNEAGTISILFSHDHYDSLASRSKENEVIKNHEILSSEVKDKKISHVRKIEREDKFVNDYSTKHTEKTLASFLEYLKTKKFPEKIEELRNRKNELNGSQEASSNDIKNAKKEFESAKRYFRGMVQKDVRFKLIEHTFLGKNIKPYPKI